MFARSQTAPFSSFLDTTPLAHEAAWPVVELTSSQITRVHPSQLAKAFCTCYVEGCLLAELRLIFLGSNSGCMRPAARVEDPTTCTYPSGYYIYDLPAKMMIAWGTA